MVPHHQRIGKAQDDDAQLPHHDGHAQGEQGTVVCAVGLQ